ncbi:MAG: class I SAM-dependent methyltransferase [Actinomycetota bacterium]|nr:class I SAM-dependent methyltransferase [Actinomycetota bacterium]
MITFELDRFGDLHGTLVLDLGAGGGRHTIAALERGATVVSFEIAHDLLLEIQGAILSAEEYLELEDGTFSIRASQVQGDGCLLPFPDETFDIILVSEVLEHIFEDRKVLSEVKRVLKKNGAAAASVPRYFGELINWLLSKEYHSAKGGHIRIYRRSQLRERCKVAGLDAVGFSYHHGLHTPYWWLKSVVGIDNGKNRLVSRYHSKLVEVMMGEQPKIEEFEAKFLNPILGKSLSIYLRRDDTSATK